MLLFYNYENEQTKLKQKRTSLEKPVCVEPITSRCLPSSVQLYGCLKRSQVEGRPDILRLLSFQFVGTGNAGKRKSADALRRANGDEFETLIYSPNPVPVKCQTMPRWTIKTAGKLGLTWHPSSAKSCCLWTVVFLLGGTSFWLRRRMLC